MPAWSLPRSLTDLLMAFRPCFTTPTFKTFTWLVVGFCAQPGTRTVTGCWPAPAWRGPGTTVARTGSLRRRAGRRMRSAWGCWRWSCRACWAGRSALPGRRRHPVSPLGPQGLGCQLAP
jgi:hypothetical protein